MTDSTITPPTKLLEDHVLTVVNRMQRAYLAKNRSKGAAWLAELRRADAEPGVTPNTWLLEFDDFPPVLSGQDGKTTPAEKAAHLAFTLYAIHQQSQTTGMHQRGKEFSLGRAVALIQQRQSVAIPGRPPIRFAALSTSDDFAEISYYARQLVKQLRSERIPLDYGRLAVQFYLLLDPRTADNVRRAWGRDFVGGYPKSTDTSNTNEKEK